MNYLNYLVGIFFFGITISMAAQQHVSYDGVKMNSNLEISEAQISKEKIMLVLHEIDMTKHQTDNCEDCPTSKSLILDVDFTRSFKFPITEDDSVYVRVTHLQKNLAEHKHNLSQVNTMNASRNRSEENQLKNQADVIKVKGQEIAKLMQEGKLSPEEAQKQLLALSEPYLNKLDHSAIANTEAEEFQNNSNFSIVFYNDDTKTESQPYSGYLYIKTFNEERFVAEFRGIHIEQCVEKRVVSSEEEKAKCSSIQSQYLPETKVLHEGSGTMTLNVAIKEFQNNRG
ncbi:hypothetical protein [Psychroserpens ponticola]|uniref:Uncharacterized protein n=1 Tax=Psychroserpens ponticola TaxID=2932268 RepID=A0ABY7RYP7_9FLAO|nr:hypothetical protein [Psychroserpens ponticola]WCO01993.1 hypothetical protein MUN68_000535 [Psychroserpens ponticola]